MTIKIESPTATNTALNEPSAYRGVWIDSHSGFQLS